MTIQKIRGTRDILPEENEKFRYIVDNARKISQRYGYDEISTPIIEPTGIFTTSLGQESDVVSKEMYTFPDRGGSSITLRPEGTAGIARFIASNSLQENMPARYFYQGPMFRYERPQRGRHRQFHQLGVELLGGDSSYADIEVIVLANHVLKELDIRENIDLEINSLGDKESRDHYRLNLVEYLEKYESELSDDSKRRLKNNPLRILDSKHINDKKILESAPLFQDYLNKESASFFSEVCSGLELLGVQNKINPRLVRGFDYYSHTAFEFISNVVGAQNAVIAGGRYDGLVSNLGGNQISGVGWAAGIERISLMSKRKSQTIRPFSIIPIGSNSINFCMKKLNEFRFNGFSVDIAFKGSLKSRMKRANKIDAKLAIIVGEEEIASEVFVIKDLDKGDQFRVSFNDIFSILEKYSK